MKTRLFVLAVVELTFGVVVPLQGQTSLPAKPLAVASPEATKIRVVSTRDIVGIPADFSPNGCNLLTITTTDGPRVETLFIVGVYDGGEKNTVQVIAAAEILGQCWNPDGSKVAVMFAPDQDQYGNKSTLGIFDVSSKRLVQVPVKVGRHEFRQTRQLKWASENGISIGTLGLLDLDTLNTRPPTAAETAVMERKVESALEFVSQPDDPNVGSHSVYVRKKGYLFRKKIADGSFAKSSPDATIAVVNGAGSEGLSLHYLDANGPEWPHTIKVKKAGLCTVSDDEFRELQGFIKQAYGGGGKVQNWEALPRAKLYKPRTNPLNGKIVGPDRESRVGTCYVIKDSPEGLYIAVEFCGEKLESGMIVADFSCDANRQWKISSGSSLVLDIEPGRK